VDGHQRGGRHLVAESARGVQRLPLELQRLAQPERLRGLLGGLEQVVERPRPVLGVREVMREDLVLLRQPVRVQLLAIVSR
jgi:hypothetical protein